MTTVTFKTAPVVIKLAPVVLATTKVERHLETQAMLAEVRRAVQTWTYTQG